MANDSFMIFDIDHCDYIKSKDIYRPKNLQENIIRLLEFCNVRIRYNEMSKELEYDIKEFKTASIHNKSEVCLEWIYNQCIKFGFTSFNKDSEPKFNTLIISPF